MTARARFGIAAAVLLLGGLVYLTRPAEPVAVAWLDQAGVPTVAGGVRLARHLVSVHISLPSWLRGSASDLAYGFALGVVLGDASRRVLAIGLVFAVGHEAAQGLGLTAGTFDVVDLLVLVASFVLAVVLLRPRGACAPASSTLSRR